MGLQMGKHIRTGWWRSAVLLKLLLRFGLELATFYTYQDLRLAHNAGSRTCQCPIANTEDIRAITLCSRVPASTGNSKTSFLLPKCFFPTSRNLWSVG